MLVGFWLQCTILGAVPREERVSSAVGHRIRTETEQLDRYVQCSSESEGGNLLCRGSGEWERGAAVGICSSVGALEGDYELPSFSHAPSRKYTFYSKWSNLNATSQTYPCLCDYVINLAVARLHSEDEWKTQTWHKMVV